MPLRSVAQTLHETAESLETPRHMQSTVNTRLSSDLIACVTKDDHEKDVMGKIRNPGLSYEIDLNAFALQYLHCLVNNSGRVRTNGHNLHLSPLDTRFRNNLPPVTHLPLCLSDHDGHFSKLFQLTVCLFL
jgi:hypothetical protein